MVNECYIPRTLEEALKIRKETKARPLAGGSDLMVQYYRGTAVVPRFPFPVMIITHLDELKGISIDSDGTVTIGALATSAEIAESDQVPYFVRQAASRMGAVSLRNSATIGGNLGNASPKGDLPQPLILLDASVVLRSADGVREIPVDDYIVGSKKTLLQDDELIVAVKIPKVEYTYGLYRKIGTRKANAISKLTLSSLITIEDGIITDFRASSGAAGPKVARSREVEELIIGRKLSELEALIPAVTEGWDKVISPHAMPEFRRGTTRRLLTSFLTWVKDCPKEKYFPQEVV
jgi:Aerobic-type carbon monoxide dehydrogenase, middle subunit CoxM/CutM homologs